MRQAPLFKTIVFCFFPVLLVLTSMGGVIRSSDSGNPYSRNSLSVEYSRLSFSRNEASQSPKNQFDLVGNFPQAADMRQVRYGDLAPGSYRFLALAIDQNGGMSPEPFVLQFHISPPFWRRWWFLSSASILAGLAMIAFFRYRLANLIELERVRTRIATDLHDDIGASLSRVAILSEVVKRQIVSSPVPGGQSIALLTEIGDTARELVESMREIIWAIDPRRDSIGAVITKVRQFASDMLDGEDINWDFKAPLELEEIKLDPDRRRHLLLIYKEAITNIARHARCRNAWLSLTVTQGHIMGEIRDDGRGFIPLTSCGNGLENLSRRAALIGGQIRIDSLPGKGSTVKLMAPINK